MQFTCEVKHMRVSIPNDKMHVHSSLSGRDVCKIADATTCAILKYKQHVNCTEYCQTCLRLIASISAAFLIKHIY